MVSYREPLGTPACRGPFRRLSLLDKHRGLGREVGGGGNTGKDRLGCAAAGVEAHTCNSSI